MNSVTSLSDLLSKGRNSASVDIPGMLGKTFGQVTLSATMPMSKLFSIYEVDLEVQRSINPRNLTKLIDYIELYLQDNQPIYFPGIIFSARGAGHYDEQQGVFRLQPIEQLYVVDGQHRLAAFRRVMESLQSQMARAKDRREYEKMEEITEKLRRLYAFPASIMIYLDINARQERQLFSDINKLPRKIGGNLAVLRDQRRYYHVMGTELLQNRSVMNSIPVDTFSERGKGPEYLFTYHLLTEVLVALFEGRMKSSSRQNGYRYDDKMLQEHVELASEYFENLLRVLPAPIKGSSPWTENMQLAAALFVHDEATKSGKFNRYAMNYAMRILPHIQWETIFSGEEKDRLPRRTRIMKAYQHIVGFYKEHHVMLITDEEDVG
jgi:DNA sulfur modification protein DndB